MKLLLDSLQHGQEGNHGNKGNTIKCRAELASGGFFVLWLGFCWHLLGDDEARGDVIVMCNVAKNV